MVLGEPVEFEDPETSPFALCGGALFHLPIEQHKTEGDLRLHQMDILGTRWGRNDIWWGEVEKKKGEYSWKKADSVFNCYKRNNIEMLAIICYSTDWLDGEAPSTDEERRAFADYARALVKRYGDQVKYWEVWNEPNISHFWQPRSDPEEYAKLLKVTYKAIKKEDPEAVVIGAVTSGTDLKFIRKILHHGAADYMDAISVHPYQKQAPDSDHRRANLPKAPRLKQMLKSYAAGDMPIWYTECGWPTIGDFSEEQQAEYLIKYFTISLGRQNIDKVYWFNLTDWGPRGSSTGGHWGLVYQDHSPKPSYLAFYVMMDLLKNYSEASEWNPGEKNIHGYVFSTEPGKVFAAWTESGEETISAPENAAGLIDIYGKNTALEKETITLTEEPVYIITKK